EKKAKPSIKRAYSRVFKLQHENFSQAALIRTHNDLFGYKLNLDNEFSFILCSTCNSNFQRLNKYTDQKKISIESTIGLEDLHIIEIMSANNECLLSVDKEGFNLEVKLFVKSGSITNPAKWTKLPSINYVKFSDALYKEIISILDNKNIKKKHYLVVYKNSAANGAGTQLMDLCNFKKFLDEYKCMKK
ncbi:790_t:CDS:1, partial [Acaulospora morrowiae]